MQGRAIMRHKWIIPVAALVLVLTIGAGAWAATDNGDQSSERTTPSSGSEFGDRAYCAPETYQGGMRSRPGGCFRDDQVPDGTREDFRQRAQDRLESFTDSVRDKMSAEDQQRLDTLLQQLEQQRQAMREAADNARETMQQLRDLMDKYGTADTESTSGSDTDTSETTAATAPTATSIVYQ